MLLCSLAVCSDEPHCSIWARFEITNRRSRWCFYFTVHCAYRSSLHIFGVMQIVCNLCVVQQQKAIRLYIQYSSVCCQPWQPLRSDKRNYGEDQPELWALAMVMWVAVAMIRNWGPRLRLSAPIGICPEKGSGWITTVLKWYERIFRCAEGASERVFGNFWTS